MSYDQDQNIENKNILNKSIHVNKDDNSPEYKKENDLLTLLDINVISTIEEFAELRNSWNQLNNLSSKGSLFISWEWLYAWWDVYKNNGKRTLYILTCHDHKNKLIGIAPFQIINNPKRYFPCNRQLIFLGTGETDGSSIFGEYMDLIIKPGHEAAVTNMISEFLFKDNTLWDGVKFQQLLDDSHLSRLFKNQSDYINNTTIAYGVRTIIELPDTYKDYLMTLRKKMRNNITRVWKRIETEQEFTLELVDNIEDVKQAINTVAELNRSRRGSMQKPSVFEYDNFNKFHHKIAELLQPLDKVRIRILRFDNIPVATLYSFVDGDMVHAYQSGFKEEYGQRYSLMTTMISQEISASIVDEKISYFNFMFSEDDNTYKNRYSSKTETMYNISYSKNGIKNDLYNLIHGPIKSHVKKIIGQNNH